MYLVINLSVKESRMSNEGLWGVFILVLTACLLVYNSMKWRSAGDTTAAFYTGVMLMCVVINTITLVKGV